MTAPTSRKVVYLLGAGASRFALPIVGEMPTAMNHHVHWLKTKYGTILSGLDFDSYKKRIEYLSYMASRYGTIDTYAKALFLQKNYSRLSDLKLHLSLYFLLEQLTEEKYSDELKSANLYMTDRRQDLRYMGWLAVLLKRANVLNENVHVVSWNYDLQIEHALAYYLDLEKPDLQKAINEYGIFPNPASPSRRWRMFPFLIHLNGIAGHCGKDHSCSEALFADLDRVSPEAFVQSVFERYKNREQNGFYETMNEWFTFAWENNTTATDGRAMALRVMSEAAILVVIGYSFPPFNRDLDQQLIEAFLPDDGTIDQKRVHLQGPGVTGDNFIHLFGLSERQPNIEVDPTAKQFYLPPELFRA